MLPDIDPGAGPDLYHLYYCEPRLDPRKSLVDKGYRGNAAFSEPSSLVGDWGALAVLAVVLYVPFARDLFRFSRLHNLDLVICSVAGVFSILWFEALKIFGRSCVSRAA